jgi:hypothetical protein
MIPHRPVGSVSSLPQNGTVWPRVVQRLVWGVAITGFSSLGLAMTPEMAVANGICNGDGNGLANAQGSIPGLSDRFAQDICRVLTMPTDSRSEGENFRSQIEPGSILTHTSASAETMTLPSLWWSRDSIPAQLGRHRLVDSWLSYTIQGAEVRVVDVMINGQFWRALTMPQRYGVLNSFGNSAQEFGYHLRFFQNNGYSARMIGVYACEASSGEALPLSATTHCLITVDTPRILQLQQAMQPQPIQPATEPSLPSSNPPLADNPSSPLNMADLPE